MIEARNLTPRDGPEILLFELAGRTYGIPSADVQEVVRAVLLEPLPDLPAPIEGVFVLRGRRVPVIDLRARLSLPSRAMGPSDHFIVVPAGEGLFALHVDRAHAVVRVARADDVLELEALLPQARETKALEAALAGS